MCHEIFDLQFFSWFEHIWAPDKQAKVFSNSVSFHIQQSAWPISRQKLFPFIRRKFVTKTHEVNLSSISKCNCHPIPIPPLDLYTFDINQGNVRLLWCEPSWLPLDTVGMAFVRRVVDHSSVLQSSHSHLVGVHSQPCCPVSYVPPCPHIYTCALVTDRIVPLGTFCCCSTPGTWRCWPPYLPSVCIYLLAMACARRAGRKEGKFSLRVGFASMYNPPFSFDPPGKTP